MRTLAGILLLTLAGATLGPVTPSSATNDHWEKTFPVIGRPDLRIISDDGRVQVGIWDRPAIGLRVTTRGWKIGTGGVRITASHEGNRATLEVREPRFRFDFGVSIRSILVEVWLPRSADLDVVTGDGSVHVPGLQGRINVRTGDGHIVVEDAKGAITLKTGDGRINGSRLDGTLTARTGDGPVLVDGRFDALTLATGDGRITAEATSGSRIGEGWTIGTGDGALTLLVPPDLKADVSAHTGDGGITVDLPMMLRGRVTHHDVRGALNGGGPPLTLRTGDGSIRLAVR